MQELILIILSHLYYFNALIYPRTAETKHIDRVEYLKITQIRKQKKILFLLIMDNRKQFIIFKSNELIKLCYG